MFSHLNGLNLALLRKAVTIFNVQNKIEATITNKLEVWTRWVDQSNYESFENLAVFLAKEKMLPPITVASSQKAPVKFEESAAGVFPCSRFATHLDQEPFSQAQWWGCDRPQCKRARQPAGIILWLSSETNFHTEAITHFWIHIGLEYRKLSHKAVMFLMPFPMSHISVKLDFH